MTELPAIGKAATRALETIGIVSLEDVPKRQILRDFLIAICSNNEVDFKDLASESLICEIVGQTVLIDLVEILAVLREVGGEISSLDV